MFRLIFCDKKFAPFFWTQFLGAFNDNLLKNSLVVLIAFRSVNILGFESNSLVALSAAIFILPFFLFSPIAGQLCDKYEKSKVVRWTKLLEVIFMLVAAVGFFTHSYSLLLFTLFLMGFQSTLFGPVKYSLIPELVTEEELTEGNAYIELGTFMAILLGTIAGGLLPSMQSENFNPDIWIGLLLVVFAVFGYLTSWGVPSTVSGAPNLKINYNPFPTILEIINLAQKKVAVWNSILAISWFWFFGAGILSVLPIFCKDYLRVDENVVTLFLVMFTMGVGLGSIACEKLSFRRVEIGLVPIGSLGMTLFLIDLYFSAQNWNPAPGILNVESYLAEPNSIRLLVDFFFMSIFGGVFIVPLFTLLQERSDADVRSRVIAANNILNAAFMVASSLLILVFYYFKFSTVQIFLVFAVLNFLVAIYVYSVVPEFTLRFYAWILSHVFYNVKFLGRENIPRNGACVLVSNHITFVDWMLIAGGCRRPARFVMYYKIFHIPLVNRIFKQAKVIPIAGAKENLNIMKSAFEEVSRTLKSDDIICIFPEGKLTSTGEMNPFRPGIVQIIEKDPVPVIPVVIHGMWGSIFSRQARSMWPKIWRRDILVEFLPPIYPQNFKLQELEEIIAMRLRKRKSD